MASSSNSGLAHPPRSNPPLRFSSGPPFPCTTPSTETCVVVVSFMIAVPFSLGRPSWAAAHPFYEHLCPDPTARRFRDDCAGFLGLGNHVERDARMSLATALKGAVADARPLQNPDFRRLWVTQIITMIGAQLTAARLEGQADTRPGPPPGAV